MITARSSVVHMPPGHYDKIMHVLRHLVDNHPGKYLKRTGESWKHGKPKRTRPSQPTKRGRYQLADEWKRMMDEEDPDGLLELWSR